MIVNCIQSEIFFHKNISKEGKKKCVTHHQKKQPSSGPDSHIELFWNRQPDHSKKKGVDKKHARYGLDHVIELLILWDGYD